MLRERKKEFKINSFFSRLDASRRITLRLFFLRFDYNTQISNLIKNNNLDISINNLISSHNLYIYLLSLVRQLYNIKEDSIIIDKIKKLDNVIDMKYIIHKIKNNNNEYIKKINQLDKLEYQNTINYELLN